MSTHNDMARKVTVAHFVTTLAGEITNPDTDPERYMALAQVFGDVAYTIQHADRDLFEVLGAASAQVQNWMEHLLLERAR